MRRREQALGREQDLESELARLRRAYAELQERVARLEERQRRIAAANEISRVLTETLDFDQFLATAIRQVSEVMNTEVVLLFLIDEETNTLQLVEHTGVSRDFVAAVDRMRVGEGLNGRVAAAGVAMAVEDAAIDPRLSREEVRREGVHSQLIAPLKSRGRVIGTLCVGVRNRRSFQPEEIELLANIGNAIGVGLENAHLYQAQRQLAAELEGSERKYRALFENANDAILVHDHEGNVTAANEALARLTGYSVDEMLHMNVAQMLSADSLRVARQVRARLLSSTPFEQPYDQQLIRKDGSGASLKLASNLLMSDGQFSFQHIARDVTSEKRLQENMRFYIQQAVRAQEEERKRIARELHDDTAQVLSSLSRQLDNLLIAKKGALAEEDVAFVRDLQDQLSRGLQAVHRFSQDLRPSLLDDLGLLPALRSMAKDISEREGIATEVNVAGAERRLPPEVELLIFRIVQEALSNVCRHAEATEVLVGIEFARGNTKVMVQDNGRGFELPPRVDELPRGGKLGLAGMQERATLAGGTLKVRSARGRGTTITVEIPDGMGAA